MTGDQHPTAANWPACHRAASALLHPIAVLALALMLLNDHLLKQACPGPLTGKLSDFCGIVLLPLFLAALGQPLLELGMRRPLTDRSRRLLLCACLAGSALVFASMQLSATMNQLYASALGLARWPFRAALHLLEGARVPCWAPVASTRDASDLVALMALPVAWWIARSRGQGIPTSGP